MTERQKFTVIKKYDHFESRSYEPCVVAQIEMKTEYQAAASSAFRHLFNYISKGNSSATPIAMTAPVIASSTNSLESSDWTISFVMPDGMKRDDLPIPNDAKVVLTDVPQQDCVALHFRGRANLSLCTRQEEILRAAAASEGILLASETRICRFDPPFKPGFLHYNEIVIPLSKKSV